MNKLIISATLAATLVCGYGCSDKKDSTEAAEDVNETKINDSTTTHTLGASKNEQQNESTYLIELANLGLTKFELSKVAVDRATNARVKTYARAAVAQHTAAKKGMQVMAQQKNLTLPTILSQESQTMLAGLVDEKAGADFDKKYLDQMEDLNEQSIDKAKGVRENTQSSDMKNFADKIIAAEGNYKEQADKLEAIL